MIEQLSIRMLDKNFAFKTSILLGKNGKWSHGVMVK